MDKKNYNLEIFFESQKKSFVILSKNKITFDEVKQRTMREFRIPKEYEKDMRFTITIKNRHITLLNDIQILNNFEEMSKNNFYLKIFFNINNNNYVYHSSKVPTIKYNPKMRIHTANNFSILSDNKNNKNNESLNIDKDMENKYKEEIKKLKEEIEKLKNEKATTSKPEIDIRKFDEKYRDLSNKNNILEQKITELENENKTLKIGANKNNITDNLLFDNPLENDPMIKEIEKIFSKLIGEHDDNIVREITGLKNAVQNIQKEQKNFYDRFKNIDDNFELLKEDIKINNIENGDDIEGNIKTKEIIRINKEKIDNKDNNIEDNFDNLDNIQDNIIDDKEDNKDNNIQNSDNKNKEMLEINQLNSDNSKNIKRNINFYDEEENNSKSFNSSKSKIKIVKKPEEGQKNINIIKEIKNSFLENNNIINKKIIAKKASSNVNKNYSKYTAPPHKKVAQKLKKIKNQKNEFNYSNENKDILDEGFKNYESSSEMNSDTKKLQNVDRVNMNNSHKNIMEKIDGKKKSTNLNKFIFNEKTSTPSGLYSLQKNDKDKDENSSKKKEINITPTGKSNTIKENIENYFINIFQNIFFYGNNGYLNMLKISDKLLKKIKDGVAKYRMNIGEVKDYCIKYISYSIIPIVNDSDTKEYQRKIIKSKINTVLEALRIDRKYFDKDYIEFSDEKKENNSNDRSFNGVNITHNKINEFRKLYELKEKDYPDEQIIKALIRYRGNRELAFQYLFY